MIKKFGILISIMVLALLACQGVSASTTYQYYTEFGTGYLNGPSGIVPVNNQIFVSNDGTDNLAYFGNFGHSFGGYIGNTGSGDGDFISPQGLAAASSAYLYVADSGNNRIQKFQLIGNTMVFTTKWGSTGAGVGQFNNPLGVAVDAAGYVYVADSNNQRVQVFSDTGTHQRTITGNFDNPMGLAVRGNAVYVTGSNDQVQILNKDTGAAIGNFGAAGAGVGQFSNPAGIAFDAGGSIYIADAGNDRVQKFQLIGNSATHVATIGQGSFNYPTDVFVDASGYVYVSDYLNNKVQVWKPYTPSGGGGGGGGGSTTLPPAVSVGTASLLTNTAGQVLQTVLLDSPSKKAQLSVSTGTYVLGSNGNPLSQISMDDLSAANLPAVPSEGTFAFGGYAVQCSPTGATFNPLARLTFSFTEAEWNTLMAQAQNTPGQLVVKWYDNANGVWVDIPTTVNEGARTLAATVSHFSIFAVFTDTAEPSVTPTPVVTPVATPVATPDVTPDVPAAPEPVSEFPWVYVIIGVVIIILIAGGAYYYTQKK